MKDSKRIRQASCRRIVWVSFTCLVTFLIPDALLNLLGLTTRVRREAWKEKVAIFILCLSIAAIFFVWVEFIASLFCNSYKAYNYKNVYSNTSHYSTVHGQVLDWQKYGNQTELTMQVNLYPHSDLSPMFPTFMLLKRPYGQNHYDDYTIEKCINGFNKSAQADNWLQDKMTYDSGYRFENDQLISCPLPNHRNKTGSPCFYSSEDINLYNRYPKKGEVNFSKSYIRKYGSALPYTATTVGGSYVILDNKVLDVSDYLESATTVVKITKGTYSRTLAAERMFLPNELTLMLFINIGKDITEMFNANIPNPDIFKECLNTLFYHGVVNGNTEGGCARVNVGLWITMGLFLLFFLTKMHMANLIQFSCIRRLLLRSIKRPAIASTMPYTLLFVPFYSEPSETIRQSLDSLARTNYPDTQKLLFFVCDGITKSRSDTKDNYQCMLDALGYSSTREPELRAYASLGQGSRKVNYARVYAGFYESGRNRVPFIMVVKVGLSRKEHVYKRPPGNRGKRDSMLIALGFLERCLNLANNRFNPLEFELYNQCYNLLSIDPRLFKYMLVTDADVQVQGDVVQRLVNRLEADPNALAISGYVRPANPEDNLITMLQIFPVYMAYYSGLAYEACMGGLMTLNGGFAMYRLWSSDGAHPKWPKLKDKGTESHKKLTKTMVSTSSSSSEESERPHRQPDPMFLQRNPHIQPICIHPTVLRGLATPRPDTLHMGNILLLGEEQYLSLVLLRSHPDHRLRFDPEAIAYTTLPTNFFALQGLQTRTLRASLHMQIEFQSMARHLGVMYWVASLTKLLDTVFSLPIVIYLYIIFINYFVNNDLAYATITISFMALIALHMIYLLFHRQFKYILWFVLYCLFGIPLFHIYFPLLAVWRSDRFYRWYDVWPTEHGNRGRLHGMLEDQEDGNEQTTVNRIQLGEFEREEAEKNALREREQAEMLDAKFNEFTGYVGYKTETFRRQRESVLSNPFEDTHALSVPQPSKIPHDIDQDSLSNSIISLEPYHANEELAEGRNAPVHSKLASYL